MKVRCIGYKTNERNFTIGNIYEVTEKGVIKGDSGFVYEVAGGIEGYSNCYEWLKAKYYNFEEVKDNDVAFPTIVIQTNGHLVAATVYKNRDCIKRAFAKCHPEDKFDYETGTKLALKRLFDAIKVISVGDKVKIVDCGESYSNYTNWITKNAPEYAVYYKYDCKVPQDTVGTVVKKEQHEGGHTTLYLIQTEINACYLIGEKGIKKVQHDYN